MRISLAWLGELCSLPKQIDAQQLAHELTMHTAEVEAVEKVGSHFAGVITAKIEQIEPHPHADRLRLASINTGKKKLKVVCGAPNIEVGQVVPFAPVGAKVLNIHTEEGGDLEINKAVIRGVPSEGMLCSGKELGLTKDQTGIMILPPDTKLGQDLKKVLALNDFIFQVDNHSLTHRPDLWGHQGWSRELYALHGWQLKEPKLASFKFTPGSKLLKVRSKDKKICPRYTAALMTNITIGPSPRWLAQRLETVGVRAINNIVDLTNYVMLELGQPLHAFAAEACKAGAGYYLEARPAKDGEKLLTLDETERQLDQDMLVIANQKEALAVAGVMGGLKSGISPKTTSIIFEAANFKAAAIRRTSYKLGLWSESSARFAKGLPTELCELALKRVVQLTQELCPGAKLLVTADSGAGATAKPRQIKTSFTYCNTLIGREISAKEIKQHLDRLGLKPKLRKNNFSVTIPWWRRSDLTIDHDVVEEVARIAGYEKMQAVMPQALLASPATNEPRQLEWRLRDLLAGLAVDEVFTYPFVGKDALQKLDLAKGELIELQNPINQEAALLRPSLLPNLLQAAKNNLRYFSDGFAIFEIGKIFGKTEKAALTIVIAGTKQANQEVFRQAQMLAHALSQGLRIKAEQMPLAKPAAYYHPSRSIQLQQGTKIVLTAGEIHPRVTAAFDLDVRLAMVECQLDELLACAQAHPIFTPVSRYPKVERDLAIIVDERLEFQSLVKTIKSVEPTLITQVELFDIYRGKQIPAGKKSLALRVSYQAMDKTLADETINGIQKKICAKISKEGGSIRD